MLAKAKKVARDIESIDKDYERLWRKEGDSIPRFIPIRPRLHEVEPGSHVAEASQLAMKAGPRPLAVREPAPLLPYLHLT